LEGSSKDTHRAKKMINNQVELTRYICMAKQNVEEDKEKNGSQQDINDRVMPTCHNHLANTQCCVAYAFLGVKGLRK